MPATTLSSLPAEMIAEITTHLPPASIANLRLASHELHAITRPAPRLSKGEWRRFHRDFERTARRTKTPFRLACTRCMKFLERAGFQDSQAKRRCDRVDGRVCFKCGVVEGYFNVRGFRHQKEVCFSCFGCQEPKKVEDEARYTSVESLTAIPLPVVVQAKREGKRWCQGCWRVVALYVNAGSV